VEKGGDGWGIIRIERKMEGTCTIPTGTLIITSPMAIVIVVSPNVPSLSSYLSVSASSSYPSASASSSHCHVVVLPVHICIVVSCRLVATLLSGHRPISSSHGHPILISSSLLCRFMALLFRHVTSSACFEPVTWKCSVSGFCVEDGDLPGVPPLILMREGLGMAVW
jgi:hypothetical protein